LAPRDEQLSWYRYRIADCLAGKQWPAALWYLERALVAAPQDWQLYADRARVEGELGRVGDRDADLTRAVEQGADTSFLQRLADEYAGRGQWRKAATTYTKACEGGACPFFFWESQALVYLKAGDQRAYQRLCAGLDEGVRELPYPAVAYAAAWVCALAPGAVSDYRRPVALAEEAVRGAPPKVKPGFLKAWGAILYRAGRFQEAVERLNESVKAGKGQTAVQCWCFLAMAHFRLGEDAEARKFLAKAVQFKIAPGITRERVELELFREEAQALVEGGTANLKQ